MRVKVTKTRNEITVINGNASVLGILLKLFILPIGIPGVHLQGYCHPLNK
jgi:hypothetical protein